MMFRLLGRFLPAQRRGDTRQEQPPMQRPSKGNCQPGKSHPGTVAQTTGHIVWGASDQQGDSETPLSLEWRFLHGKVSTSCACVGGQGAGIQERWRGHLPAASVPCSIRLAYQAADACHPRGQSKLAEEQGRFAGKIIPTQVLGSEVSHRQGVT